MSRLIYSITIFLYRIGISVAAVFNTKARKLFQGKKNWKKDLIDLPETKVLQNGLMEMMAQQMEKLKDPILGRFNGIRHVY